MQHTFFAHFFAVVFTTATWNFQKLLSYTFLSFTFLSLPLIFTLHWWPLAFLILSPPLQNFPVVLPKKCLLCLLYLALNICRPFSRWPSLACHLLSLFLCVSLALFSKFVDMTINLSLILQKTRIQRQFPISIFLAFIDSLVVSALQDAGGYAIYRQNNLELHLGCHSCWLSYFTLVYLWCGRTVGRSVYGHVITKFSRMGSLPHFLTHGAPLCASHARAPLLYNLFLISTWNRGFHPGLF